MLTNVNLSNFRSHEKLKLGFSPLTNVIIGKNGSGKTNILEAILMLASGKSFRASDSAVIRFNTSGAKVTADFSDFERAVKLELTPSGQIDKTFILQGKTYKRLSFHKTVPIVLFEPNFTRLVSSGPEARRDYFDQVLSKTEVGYQALLNNYRRALAQRNSLLKQPIAPIDQLFVWDIRLAQMAASIVARRLSLTELINQQLSQVYSQVAAKQHRVVIKYTPSVNQKDYLNNLIKGLQKHLNQDKERGFTSLGPHRDDYGFFINRQAAATSASRGENRSLLLALKIIEANLVERARDQKPTLLLDDVFSELDETRQTKLVEYFKDNQVIITSTTITPLIQGVSGQIFEL